MAVATCIFRRFLLLLLVYIFASLEQFFAIIILQICTVIVGFFFCSDATLVQNFCSDVSDEVSGKITSPEKNCSDAILVQKICSDVSSEVSGEIHSALLRTVFCYNKAKAGLFCFTEAIFRILVRNIFASFI
jgi:hypothetical protein